ncbi:MAG: helix-turn-helix transcriptional regulator [Clostridia bacterium]|nr:helix-turn-helix transcriptional regulator [Clostridia bacterium]
MEIGKNIAEIRKKRGLTQEELGAKLGVTNQAVSKWENQTSLPDVMLLPEIAAALGVTLNTLYGIEEKKEERVRADDFPEAAREMLGAYFVRHAGA